MLAVAATVGLLVAEAAPVPSCEVFWRDLTGYGHEQHLRVAPVRGRSTLSTLRASWWPVEADRRGVPTRRASTTALRWSRLSEPATVEPAGVIEGHRLLRVSYSPLHVLFAWERSADVFCPFALLEGSEGIAEDISMPTVFESEGREVVAFKVFLAGQGRLQDSCMFAFVEGELTHLRMDAEEFREAVRKATELQQVTLHHRGGGFCEGSLVWENAAGHSAEEARSGRLVFRVQYAIRGHRLSVKSAQLVPNRDPRACRQ